MKKLLLILLISNFALAQVQIDFETGFNIYVTNTYPLSPSVGTSTNNAEINAIFLSYGSNHLVQSYGNNYPIIFADYNGTNLNGFINDLTANSNVTMVRKCYQNTNPSNFGYTYADRLYVKLYDNNNGNPIGTNANGNVITSNSAVNLIFDNYQVKSMNLLIGQWYTIYFEGDITELKDGLDNLNNGVDTTDLEGVPMLLGNSESEKSRAVISPNPFSYSFDIQTTQTITNYSIIDITGKTIISTSSKSELDNQSSQLSTGIYILNLDFDNGQRTNYKLIKK
jgi:hypothetical protein